MQIEKDFYETSGGIFDGRGMKRSYLFETFLAKEGNVENLIKEEYLRLIEHNDKIKIVAAEFVLKKNVLERFRIFR